MDFYGSGLTRRQYEAFTLMQVSPGDREGEADLIRSRWFDYSLMHPAEATYLYAHLYKEQTKAFCEAYIDARTSDAARAFTPDDIFHSRDITGMWLARRCADALGVPYEFALRFASLRALNRTYRCFPRPNQLYGEEFETDLKAAWEESLASSLRYSRDERFKARNYAGSQVQKGHMAFVVSQIKRRDPASHPGLLARMFAEGILSSAHVTDFFDEAVVTRSESLSRALALSHR